VCEAETRGKKFAESGNEDFEPEIWLKLLSKMVLALNHPMLV